MINNHNSLIKNGRPYEIKRTVFYTGYLLVPVDTNKLLNLVKLPPHLNESDVKFLANSILITTGPAQPYILNKVGGIGYKQSWQVTGFAWFHSNICAARVAPVPPISVYHTDNHTPYIILAHHKNARPADANKIQNWEPVSADKQYVLQTVVGEKVQLRIEYENEAESEYDSLFERKTLKRRHSPPQQNHRGGYGNEENRRLNGGSGGFRGGNQNRGRGSGGWRGGGNNNNRGGRGGGPGRGGGGSSRGRGGGPRGYKSLDDVGSGGGRYNAQRGEPNYDDYVPPSGEGYNAAFPALGGNGSGGLPYGK